MSVSDFLSGCTPIFEKDRERFRSLRKELAAKPCIVQMIPAVMVDLWPLYILEDSAASAIVNPEKKTSVYLAPLAAHSFYGKNTFEDYIYSFYQGNPLPSTENLYGCRAEWVMLLSYPGLRYTIEPGNVSCNVVCTLFRTAAGNPVYVFSVCETPEGCWREVIEANRIQICTLVDSSKGLGDMISAAPLYKMIRTCEDKELLPGYFLRGKHINNNGLEQFKLLLELPEQNGSGKTRLFSTGW